MDEEFFSDVEQAVSALRSGSLVAFPTETVYGLGADATQKEAVAAIYHVKGRPSNNPLIVHVSGAEMAARYADLSEQAKALMDAFWPGALALVLPQKERCPLAKAVSASGKTVALRAPNHPLAQALIQALGEGIAAPSANRSGRISPTTAEHVKEELEDALGNELAMILDDGPCTVGVESTIVDATGDRLRILRAGSITREQIAATVGEDAIAVQAHIEDNHTPLAPGMLTSHYAPNLPVRMHVQSVNELKEGSALLGFGQGELAQKAVMNLSTTGDLDEAARNLFAMLRMMDVADKYKEISVMAIPMEGVGVAINDRLRRAAAPR